MKRTHPKGAELMRFDQMFPSRFWKAADVEKPVRATIRLVQMESLGEDDEVDKPVCYFEGYARGLCLNKTNAEAIATIAGSEDSDDWTGVEIELYQANTLYLGKRTPCVRIRKPRTVKPAGQQQPIAPPEAISDSWEEEDIPDPGAPMRGQPRPDLRLGKMRKSYEVEQ